MTKQIKAPTLPAAEKIGPRQRKFEKQIQEKNMQRKEKIKGIVILYIKVNLLLGGIALWQAPSIQLLIGDFPLYKVVAATILAVFAYLELKPYFVGSSLAIKVKKVAKKKSSLLDAAKTDLIED